MILRDYPGNEAIAAPVHGLDEPRRFRVIPKSLAQLADADHQHHITHRRLGPDSIEQGRLGDQLPRMSQQTLQHGKRLRAEGNRLCTPPEARIEEIQTYRQGGMGRLGRHTTLPTQQLKNN
jgi:hypothetical protein